MTSSGIKYSNIDALHDSSARDAPGRRQRPSELEPVFVRNPAGARCATKLASRASEASVS